MTIQRPPQASDPAEIQFPEGETTTDETDVLETSGPAEVPPEGEPKTPAETPPTDDTAAQLAAYAALQKAHAKLQVDFKAVQTGVLRQSERDRLLEGILERLDRNEKKQDALSRALASDSVTSLPDEIGKIEADATKKAGQRNFAARATSLYTQLEEAAQDIEGKALLDLKTAPELVEQRNAWNDAYQRGDLVDMASVVGDVRKVARKVERERNQAAASEKVKVNKEAVKQAVVESGLNDLSSGRPAGGTRQYANVDAVVDAVMAAPTGEAARAILDKLPDSMKRQVQAKVGLAS